MRNEGGRKDGRYRWGVGITDEQCRRLSYHWYTEPATSRIIDSGESLFYYEDLSELEHKIKKALANVQGTIDKPIYIQKMEKYVSLPCPFNNLIVRVCENNACENRREIPRPR